MSEIIKNQSKGVFIVFIFRRCGVSLFIGYFIWVFCLKIVLLNGMDYEIYK